MTRRPAKVQSIAAGRKLARRDKLILDHLPLVGRIARKLKRTLPACFDLDDLISAGTIGLIQVAEIFDPGRGVAFGAFARKRIKGEMVESARKRNWTESTRVPINEHDRDPRGKVGSVVGEELQPHHVTPDPNALAALEAAVESRIRYDLVNSAIAALPRRHAVVIELHYRRAIPIQDIAGTAGFDVNASRVTQLHTEALRELRKFFALRGQKAA